jgi:ATP:ADP antiporter, AAA family
LLQTARAGWPRRCASIGALSSRPGTDATLAPSIVAAFADSYRVRALSSVEATVTPGLGERLGIRPGEATALFWSFLYFFSLLSGYYVMRPVRDAMGALHALEWLFTGTFICMLLLTPVYGALVSRFPRRVFLPVVYLFFIGCLLGFFLLLQADTGATWRSAVFFIWVAVFNLFAVSVFWSFMSDIFETDQAKRFYGMIAAGGTIGAITGPTITQLLVHQLGVPQLLLISAGLLAVCLVCILRLIPWALAQERRRQVGVRAEAAMGGGVLEGARRVFQSRFLIALVALMFFGVAVGTILYNQMAAYTRVNIPDAALRTAWYARIDLAINALTVTVQIFITRALMVRFGVGPLLVIPAGLVALGFAALTVMPGAPLLLALVMVITRAGNFSLLQPARESLFTRVDRVTRYKAKNFIDTVIYRGGDLTFAWVHKGLIVLGLGSAGIAGVGVACAIGLTLSGWWVWRLSRALPDHHEDANRK